VIISFFFLWKFRKVYGRSNSPETKVEELKAEVTAAVESNRKEKWLQL
jgi:hypothetical protein